MTEPGAHTVTVPRPNRDGAEVTATCECGWSLAYTWGHLGDARNKAELHINQAAGSEAIDISDFSIIRYIGGESL